MTEPRDPLLDAIHEAGRVPPPPDRDAAFARAMQPILMPSPRQSSPHTKRASTPRSSHRSGRKSRTPAARSTRKRTTRPGSAPSPRSVTSEPRPLLPLVREASRRRRNSTLVTRARSEGRTARTTPAPAEAMTSCPRPLQYRPRARRRARPRTAARPDPTVERARPATTARRDRTRSRATLVPALHPRASG